MKPSRQSQQTSAAAGGRTAAAPAPAVIAKNCRLLAALLLVVAAAANSSHAHLATNTPSGAGAAKPPIAAAAAAAAAATTTTLATTTTTPTKTTSGLDKLALPSTQAIQVSVSKWNGRPQQQHQALAPMATSNHGAKVRTAAGAGVADMQTAAGHHYGKSHGGHGKYYMYAESPKKGAYKAGFRRGNHKHMIERKEWQHKSHAGGYMKWHGKKGKGSHKWEYNHSKGKHHHHHHY